MTAVPPARPAPPAPAAASPAPVSPARRSLWSIGLCAAALLLGAGAFLALASLRKPPAAREPIVRTYNVEVFQVERADLQETISGFGTARADREVVLAAQVAGEIVEVHPSLKVGLAVSAGGDSEGVPGDRLLVIDPRPYVERVVQAEKRLAEDDAELERLERELTNNERLLKQAQEDVEVYQEEYDRVRRLQARGAAGESAVTQARLELQSYQSALTRLENERELFPLRIAQVRRRREANQADLRLAELDVSRTVVRPPFEARISEVQVERGQYVRVGDPLLRLNDASAVEIPVSLPLVDYARLKPLLDRGGRPLARLQATTLGNGPWHGELVRTAPQADERTRTIQVFLRVNNAEQSEPLVPGTFVEARIEGPLLSDAVIVPRDALVNGRLFVATPAGVAEPRSADVIRNLQALALVRDCVAPGEQVILTNLDVLHQGARVDVRAQRRLDEELERHQSRLRRMQAVARQPNGPR